ncbi:dicarboxylate/amino acid:cation symporter [Sphingomonas sp. C3-2]|uniref:dicarboxylate/amino acid:cation symporter n=1 Tax=Sphingomonas sp. C3-2 TaxID=3062169 RepID=UPI00294ACABF|nr:dicarboxylate/amino acid:cation symporter [Sphingomonas sp. C3-2]WOK35321.1 dicarboxylate/amino acid:cation symporter [Sphingomonas sp. C3-2]
MAHAWRIVAGLVVGLVLGILCSRTGFAYLDATVAIAEPVGGLWLDALKMTIIPLVIALLITGIARTADSARGGGLALRSVALFIGLLWLSTAIAAILVPALLNLWPMPEAAAAALRGALGQPHAAVTAAPGLAEFLRSVVPTNPVAAAASNALLPLILFTALFALAVTRLPAAQREPLIAFFGAIADAMLVMIGWVLWLAPLGVLALAFVVGVHAGTAAIGALVHYIIIVSAAGLAAWLLAYPVARLGGGVSIGRFIRAVAPAQAVALSTQSSLASLPTMLRGSEALGVQHGVANVSLPIAVAIFRVTSPAMNLAVALYVAHWFGIALTPGTIAVGAAVAAITTLGSVSLPGQASFLTSITPIAAAMGVPIEPLALLVAVEMIPDLVRTVGNVTMDVAATTVLQRIEDRAADADG